MEGTDEQSDAAHPAGRPGPAVAPAVTVGPYVLLAILVLFTVGAQARRRGPPCSSTWPCAALAAAWMLWMFTLHPAWRVRPRVMAVFFTVLS